MNCRKQRRTFVWGVISSLLVSVNLSPNGVTRAQVENSTLRTTQSTLLTVSQVQLPPQPNFPQPLLEQSENQRNELANSQLEVDDWQLVTIPSSPHPNSTYWLRCWVKVHDNFFTPHERNLFEESVGVHIRGFIGAHEVWINGKQIGTAGSFPPTYSPAEQGLIRHKVPLGTLQPQQWNEIAIRVYQPGPQDGFHDSAPFIMNYFYECVFAGQWELLRADDYQPGAARPDQPIRATFAHFRDSQEVLGRAEQVPGPRLPPHESAVMLQANEEAKVELLLHEPIIAQPFQFSFDDRGRLWVAQSRQYPYPAGLRMLSRDRYYRSHYDRVPPAPPHHDPGADLISIHEDTTGDGQFDTHKVFVSELNMANSVVKGDGGVWVMHTPYLLFYPDANNDDVPDGPPEVHLSGFGLEDTHSIANGLVWGPDGWLYGCQGSTTSCRVIRPGIELPDASGVYFEGCMVWRYHPSTRAFEIFSEGGGNTFGLEFDAAGRLYSGHNGAETRGWHFVQGGFYLMQHADPGKFGPPRNPYAFGDLPMMATSNSVVRFTHFGAFADAAALPSQWNGLLLALDPLHNEIIASQRIPRGATFSTSDQGVILKSRDEAFRPVYIANAPDGSVYIADMYEYYIAHGQHYQNQIDTTTGRIYRLFGNGNTLLTDFNAAAKSLPELEAWLGHRNKWHRFMASRELGRRGDANRLQASFGKYSDLEALHALWALYQMNQVNEATWLAALQHGSPTVRLWAVRLLGDRYGMQRNLGLPPVKLQPDHALSLPDAIWSTLKTQMATESDAEVRSQVASTARRLTLVQGLELIDLLMQNSADVSDPYIPLLIWWFFEAHLPEAADTLLPFVLAPERYSLPMAVQHLLPRLARRFAVDGRRHHLLHVATMLNSAQNGEQVAAILQGFEDAYRGRAMTALPDELLQALAKVGGGSLLFRMRQGETEAFEAALSQIVNSDVSVSERVILIRSFAELSYPAVVPVLTSLVAGNESPEIRQAAFAALGKYDQPGIGAMTLAVLPNLEPETRPAAFALLVSRPDWTRQLIQSLKSSEISATWLPANIVDQLRRDQQAEVREVVAALLPQTTDSLDWKSQLAAVETMLSEAAGNPYSGEKLYMDRCSACHKLFFKGGNLGPDLTHYQRDNLGTMLLSIVNPSAEIREGYELIRVLTSDGRIVQGFQVDRDQHVLVLRGPDGQDISLGIEEIEELAPAGKSLMPDGLLNGLSPQEIRDLFAYLRISQPFTN